MQLCIILLLSYPFAYADTHIILQCVAHRISDYAQPETHADDRQTLYHNCLDHATDAVDLIHRRPVSFRMLDVTPIILYILTTLKVPVDAESQSTGTKQGAAKPSQNAANTSPLKQKSTKSAG
ncbi:putative fused cobalt transport protein CbiMQ [Trichinella pseudospiralis]